MELVWFLTAGDARLKVAGVEGHRCASATSIVDRLH
jgi:hypothetical protein